MADLAIALDLPGVDQALRVVDAVGDAATWYKIGPILFAAGGPAVVREVRRRGKRVFLDLKWHDIPSTVGGASAAAAALGVELATVHLAGGRRMLEAAQAACGTALRLLGVGVLTSLSADEFAAAVGRAVQDVGTEQERLVRQGMAVGLGGYVTAAAEAPRLRAVVGPGAWLVVPGIRRPGEATADQTRTATPAEAVRAGADLLVVGRPVTGAVDPRAAVLGMRSEMPA